MSIGFVRTFFENSVELHAWVAIDVNVGECSFLSYCKVLSAWMNSDRANTVSVSSKKDKFFFGSNV